MLIHRLISCRLLLRLYRIDETVFGRHMQDKIKHTNLQN